jgi:O-antigen/teichoic acid export membrane protein
LSGVTSGRLVARNFAALGAGEVLARLIAFGAMVYAARVLGTSMYGTIGFALAVLLYLNRVADFGIELSGVRELAKDPAQLERLASAVLSVRLLLAAALIAATALLALVVLPDPDGAVLAVYSLTLLAVAGGTRWVYLGLEQTRAVATARAAGEAVMALLVLALVHGPGDVVRAPMAQVVGDSLAALLLVRWLRRRGHGISLRWDWPLVRPLFRRAWPLVLSALLGLVIYNSGLIILRIVGGTTEVGLYSAGVVLVSFLINLGLSYRMSLLPTLTRLADADVQRRELYRSAMAHVVAIVLPISLGGFLLAPQIVHMLFGPDYAAAAPALQVLIWSVPLCLLRDVPSASLLADAREDKLFHLTAWGAALNLLLNLLLIPRYGIPGAAWATVATESVRLALAFGYVRSQGFGLRDAVLFARVAAATIVMMALLLLARPASLWIALPLGAAGYLTALIALRGIRLRRGEFPALDM